VKEGGPEDYGLGDSYGGFLKRGTSPPRKGFIRRPLVRVSGNILQGFPSKDWAYY